MKSRLHSRIIVILATTLFSCSFAQALTPEIYAHKPKLVLVIVIDQFGSRYLMNNYEKLAPIPPSKNSVGGLRLLMEKGAYFPLAEYEILQSMTAPGHATILTGSVPSLAGIPVNDWYDTQLEDRTYCTEDRNFQTVPNEKVKEHVGTSPRNLIANTVGDQLKEQYPQAQVISIALKDRSAILMGGHRANLALWLNENTQQWVSSNYYLKEGKLPEWLNTTNQNLKQNPCTKRELCGFSKTVDLVEAAIKQFPLGQDNTPDILAVSFSTHDYRGHFYGPNSPELLESTLEADKTIARLLTLVKAAVPGGLENVLVVLTGDHGVVPLVEEMQNAKITSGRIDVEKIKVELEAILLKKYGPTPNKSPWLPYMADLNFYLNHKAIAEKNLQASELENTLREYLKKITGIKFVFTHTDFKQHLFPPSIIEMQIKNTYYPGRSGDVIAIVEPNYVDEERGTTHLTGYTYDRMVPLILMGKNIRPNLYPEIIPVTSIAPTLSLLLGTTPPNLSGGKILSTVFK